MTSTGHLRTRPQFALFSILGQRSTSFACTKKCVQKLKIDDKLYTCNYYQSKFTQSLK